MKKFGVNKFGKVKKTEYLYIRFLIKSYKEIDEL